MKPTLSLIAFFFCFSLLAQRKLIRTDIEEGISLSIPDSFINMSSSDRIQKFVSAREPLAMFTSDTRNADLGINKNIMQWKEEDTQTIYGFYKASIQSLFDDIHFIQDTIRTINSKEFIVFEFISSLKKDNAFSNKGFEKNYTYIQYTSYQDQVLLFNFGCPGRFANQWKDVAREIMETIKVTD